MAEKKQNEQAPEQATPAAAPIDLEALKAALLAELKAELKAEDGAKEQDPGASDVDPWLEEYVQVQLFKDGKDYKDDVFVSVNGENCVIKRGYPVKVKRKFALVLEQSQQQDVRAAEYAEAKQKEFDQQVKYFNL